MGPEEAGLQPDGFLEQLGAFPEPVLLKADGAQHRTGRGSRLGIGERQLGLLVGFLEPPFLDQDGRPLEGLARLGAEGDRRRQAPHRSTAEASAQTPRPGPLVTAFAFARGDAPSQETRRSPGRDGIALTSPLRHGYHLYQ